MDGILVTMPHKFTAIAIELLAAGVSELVVHDADASRVAALLDLLAGPGGDRVIAGHGVTPFIGAAQAAGCKTADGGDMVEGVQDLMAGFMLEGPSGSGRSTGTGVRLG